MGAEGKDGTGHKGCCSPVSKVNLLLYSSHVLAAWGDRMWQFAVGMFLVDLYPGSLRLTAIYGFSSSGAVLLLGAIVGNWVDKNPRLPVARNAIIIQNAAVAMSAVMVCIALVYPDYLRATWGGGLETLVHALVIVFAVVADVATIARQIAIERDWIVVLCRDDQKLTEMSAKLRTIDLTCNTLAPIATGQVMTYGSVLIGAVALAAWNVVFFFVEFGLLYGVYRSVPSLAVKNIDKANSESPASGQEHEERQPLLSKDALAASGGYGTAAGNDEEVPSQHDCLIKQDGGALPTAPAAEKRADVSSAAPSRNACLLLFDSFVVLYRGWRTYMSQDIVLAGLALSTLYMTVLGFDNITTGFALQQGLSESMISILLAAGAVVGVIGTLVFPCLRRCAGLKKTGVLAFFVELACLTMCVVSVFLPGSPFEVYSTPNAANSTMAQPAANNSESSYVTSGVSGGNSTLISIIVLMAGIVTSRFGLWIADLTITQLLLEHPEEHERGIVNGVQNSLNKLMETFGYLIFVSYGFIGTGGCLFVAYACRAGGSRRRANRLTLG